MDRPCQPEAVVTLFKADDPTPDDEAALFARTSKQTRVSDDDLAALDAGEAMEWLATPRQRPVRDEAPRNPEVIQRVQGGGADRIAKVEWQRDDAIAKLHRVQVDRDAIAKRLRDVESERDAANRELTRRPKGATRDASMFKVAEKSEDVASYHGAPEPKEPDPLEAIRKAQRRPLRGWDDR